MATLGIQATAKFDSNIRAYHGSLKRKSAEALLKAANEGAALSRTYARDPNLAASIVVDTHLARFNKIAWGSNHKAARIIEEGAPPHLIGRPGQFLSGKAGERHRKEPFAARGPVSHPGVKPRLYLQRALDKIGRKLPEIMQRSIDKA